MIYDFCVIGGGIVGLATAMKLLEKQPGASLVLLEKEDSVAVHQTGHNSGVIHAGIYYVPGSLKARLCAAGATATKEFCRQHGIPFDACGKLIVATDAVELARIVALQERASANGLTLRRIGQEELKQLEPNISGIGALLSPETAIVDYRRISAAMAGTIRSQSAELCFGVEVDAIREEQGSVAIGAAGRSWTARTLVACAGLQADRLAALAGAKGDFRIVPFRGEYYRLPPEKNDIVRHLIYPAPNPDMPFLGIHLTRMIDGGVTVGPNAVLGLAREGYPKLSANFRDMASLFGYPGFWRLIASNAGYAVGELKNSIWKRGYLAECRKYCPSLNLEDLMPWSAGIRAQAVTSRGEAIHDFLVVETARTLHVCNAPSPAATSAIPIGDMIAARCLNWG